MVIVYGEMIVGVEGGRGRGGGEATRGIYSQDEAVGGWASAQGDLSQ